ncbi:hypothetical protein [Herbiconiux solani]|uniref:hypothetical protein n=1 Tax=Herbiconiux solani TaxID=661329 RepID=UPI00082442E6|nr:hypothetical protein [Herbiconiux solani]
MAARTTADKPAETTEAETPTETRLDDNVTEPSTVAPGDAPADTTDPTEIASTVIPQPSQEALKQGTVNGVLPVKQAEKPKRDTKKDRFEEYDATKPDGTVVRIRRNIETGESSVVTK